MIFSQSAPAYFSAYGDTGTNLTDWYTVMDWVPLNGELSRHSNDIAEYKYRPDVSEAHGIRCFQSLTSQLYSPGTVS